MSSANVDVLHIDNKAKMQNAVQEYLKEHGPTSKLLPSKTSPYQKFQLGHGGSSDEQLLRAIDIAKRNYQTNLLIGGESNSSYLNIFTNNIGDTSQEGSDTVLNTKFMEQAVLDYFAELWHIQYPHNADDPESYWGSCLAMGGTEGNMYGMWNARDYLSGKKILIDNSLKIPRSMYRTASKAADNQNAYNPITFYSEDTQYSKIMAMLNIRTFYAEGSENYAGLCPLENSNGEWPMEVPLYKSGSMDLDALAVLVEFFASKGHPIIVCFNYGSSFRGAYDDVESACGKLSPILQKYNLLEREVHYDVNDHRKFETRSGFWFHVDGFVGAAHTSFLEMAYQGGLLKEKAPTFDFRLPMVHSIAMSGHTQIGAPIPSGVYMTRTKYQMLPPEVPEYIGTPDTTFAGHRSAFSAMLMWEQIARSSYEDQVSKAIRLEQLAVYAEALFLKLQEEDRKESPLQPKNVHSLVIKHNMTKKQIDDLMDDIRGEDAMVMKPNMTQKQNDALRDHVFGDDSSWMLKNR